MSIEQFWDVNRGDFPRGEDPSMYVGVVGVVGVVSVVLLYCLTFELKIVLFEFEIFEFRIWQFRIRKFASIYCLIISVFELILLSDQLMTWWQYFHL